MQPPKRHSGMHRFVIIESRDLGDTCLEKQLNTKHFPKLAPQDRDTSIFYDDSELKARVFQEIDGNSTRF